MPLGMHQMYAVYNTYVYQNYKPLHFTLVFPVLEISTRKSFLGPGYCQYSSVLLLKQFTISTETILLQSEFQMLTILVVKKNFCKSHLSQSLECRSCSLVIEQHIITLRTKLSGAVYCNRSCLFVCGSVTTITRNCVH